MAATTVFRAPGFSTVVDEVGVSFQSEFQRFILE
jgi:hypothetical protein